MSLRILSDTAKMMPATWRQSATRALSFLHPSKSSGNINYLRDLATSDKPATICAACARSFGDISDTPLRGVSELVADPCRRPVADPFWDQESASRCLAAAGMKIGIRHHLTIDVL
jgi:hypothetical protein